MPEKPITKEYFEKRFRQYQSDMHIMTTTAMSNMRAFYAEEAMRDMGALKEGFQEKVQVALDQVKSIDNKTDDHDLRICKLEELCYK
jgi:hypothetical protein